MFSKRRRLEPKKSFFPSTASLSGCVRHYLSTRAIGSVIATRGPKAASRADPDHLACSLEDNGKGVVTKPLKGCWRNTQESPEPGWMGGRERLKGFLQLSLGNRGKEKSARQRGKHVQYLGGRDAWPLWEP